MNTQEAKAIAISDYLYSLGIKPKKQRGNEYWYCSPLRNESTPSFKVDNRLNIWYDHGLGKGGNIIDLIMQMYNLTDISAVLSHLSGSRINKQENSFSFQQQNTNSKISNIITRPISNPTLISFIKSRKIGLNLANKYCEEVHYTVNGRKYFAVGFKNDSEGYELSNPYFKGSTSPKDITIIERNSNSCMIFEGFWDFLSYLTLKKYAQPNSSCCILNSVNQLDKAMDFIKRHEAIHVFADNDEAGKVLLKSIETTRKTVIDHSVSYKSFKDLNEYLCNMKPIKKQSRGRRM